MNSTTVGTAELDLEISLAWVALGGARRLWTRCPSAENERRMTLAEDEVNRLLDARLVTARA